MSPAIIHDPAEVVARASVLSLELGLPIEPGFEVFVAKPRSSGPDENEWTYCCKDGSRIPVLLSVTAIRGADGSISGFLGVAKNLTLSKQARERDSMLDGIRQALAGGSARDVERAAHKLEGALLNLAARPAADAALRLAECGHRGSLPTAEQLAELTTEVTRLSAELALFRERVPA